MDMEILSNYSLSIKRFLSAYSLCLYICIIIFFQSCEKDADVKLPVVEKKLVVVSFISPQDSLIKVNISLTQPIYNTQPSTDVINDAEVTISSILGSYKLLFNPIEKKYFIDSSQLKIRAGITYTIKVNTPDGKNAWGSTTIPSLNTTLIAKVERIVSTEYTHALHGTWSDKYGSEDYYKVAVKYPRYTDSLGNYYEETAYNLASDKNFDGQTLNSKVNFSYNGLTDLYGYLLHLSQEYYLYQEKLDLSINSTGPFSEPVQLFTNMNGGLGVFAGFNQFKIKATF